MKEYTFFNRIHTSSYYFIFFQVLNQPVKRIQLPLAFHRLLGLNDCTTKIGRNISVRFSCHDYYLFSEIISINAAGVITRGDVG